MRVERIQIEWLKDKIDPGLCQYSLTLSRIILIQFYHIAIIEYNRNVFGRLIRLEMLHTGPDLRQHHIMSKSYENEIRLKPLDLRHIFKNRAWYRDLHVQLLL